MVSDSGIQCRWKNVYSKRTVNVSYYKKIGSIPVGVHASSTIENIEVGASIRVRYNPNKPKQSYLPENNGYHIS